MSLYDHCMFRHVAIVATYELVFLLVPRQGLLSTWYACKAHVFLNSQFTELLDPFIKKKKTPPGHCRSYRFLYALRRRTVTSRKRLLESEIVAKLVTFGKVEYNAFRTPCHLNYLCVQIYRT